MLEQYITQCGFSSGEVKILSYLLEYGSGAASLIAKRVGLKRPTVYALLESLIEQGYATRNKTHGTARFSAIPHRNFPEIVRSRAEARFETLREATKSLERLFQELPHKGKKDIAGFEIETIETEEGVYSQLYSSLVAGDFCGIFDPQVVITKKSKKIITEFLQKTSVSRPAIREIAVKGQICTWYKNRIANPRHQVKEMPLGGKLPCDLIFSDRSVIVIYYEPGKETAIAIHHPDFYQTMLIVFEILWGTLP